MYTYDYPRPEVTVDAVIFKDTNDSLEVLLIRRKKEPFKEKWAFPGGFMEMNEDPEEAGKRELAEETGLKIVQMAQIGAFGGVERDPRGRVLSIAYAGFVEAETAASPASDASEAEWFSIFKTPDLAFDHREILNAAIDKLRIFLYVSLNQNHTFLGLESKRAEKIFTILKEY